jgi:hypothetical protein
MPFRREEFMTSPLLLISFLFAGASVQPAIAADAPSAAGICTKAMLPQFQAPSIPVSFQVPAKQKRPLPFSFAEEAKKYRLRADCDGTACGCDIDYIECRDACNGTGGGCLQTCVHQYNRCALCCCGGPC